MEWVEVTGREADGAVWRLRLPGSDVSLETFKRATEAEIRGLEIDLRLLHK